MATSYLHVRDQPPQGFAGPSILFTLENRPRKDFRKGLQESCSPYTRHIFCTPHPIFHLGKAIGNPLKELVDSSGPAEGGQMVFL